MPRRTNQENSVVDEKAAQHDMLEPKYKKDWLAKPVEINVAYFLQDKK